MLYQVLTDHSISVRFNNLYYLACDKYMRFFDNKRACNTLETFGSKRIDHSFNLQKTADNLHSERVKKIRII